MPLNKTLRVTHAGNEGKGKKFHAREDMLDILNENADVDVRTRFVANYWCRFRDCTVLT